LSVESVLNHSTSYKYHVRASTDEMSIVQKPWDFNSTSRAQI